MEFIDIAIIGGGPAGLTAAATIVRQLHTAVVFDNHKYGESNSSHMHTVPTWDHRDPKEFREAARADILARYSTVQFADVGVAKIKKKTDSHFHLVDESGKEYNFRKIILAFGFRCCLPDIDGFHEAWGSRIVNSMFFSGYEDRGAKSSGVLVVKPVGHEWGLNIAGNAAQFSDVVTLYTHGDQDSAAQLAQLVRFATDNFKVDSRQIKRVAVNGNGASLKIEFADGSTKEEAFLVHCPLAEFNNPFIEQLGLAMSPAGHIEAHLPVFQTSVRGVFLAGDIASPHKAFNMSMATGNGAAVGAIAQLQAEKYGFPSLFDAR